MTDKTKRTINLWDPAGQTLGTWDVEVAEDELVIDGLTFRKRPGGQDDYDQVDPPRRDAAPDDGSETRHG